MHSISVSRALQTWKAQAYLQQTASIHPEKKTLRAIIAEETRAYTAREDNRKERAMAEMMEEMNGHKFVQ